MRTYRFTGFGCIIFGCAALGGGVAACGSSFGTNDCEATRTCPLEGAGHDAGASSGGADDGDDTAAGGRASDGHGSDAHADGGAASECAHGDCPNAGNGGDAACVGEHCGPSNSAPRVLSVTPDDASVAVDTDAGIEIEFSEPVDDATVTAENIRLLDGDRDVPVAVAHDGAKVTLTPELPLYLLHSYELRVSTDVTDLEGSALGSAFSAQFTTRDGSWSTTNAFGAAVELSSSVSLTGRGNALVAWLDLAKGGCPSTARWFRRGVTKDSTAGFDAADTQCSGLVAASNALGVGAVSWMAIGGSVGVQAQQFRDSWLAEPAQLSNDVTFAPARLAVDPSGMSHLFVRATTGVGLKVFRTDASGNWSAKADALSADQVLSPVSSAFAANGDGVAVWAAETSAHLPEILWSRYTTSSAKWSTAKAIPNARASNVHASITPYAPAVAITEDGDAVAAWMENETDVGTGMVTSVFSRLSGWSSDTYSLMAPASSVAEAPGLTYDGKDFLLAWVTAPEFGAKFDVNVWRYSTSDSAWSDAAPDASASAAAKMPRIASDERGNGFLVWAEGVGTYSLFYQRITAGEFGGRTAVPGGSVTSRSFISEPLNLAMNASGMAALVWGNRKNNGEVAGIRLASFY